MNDKGNAEILLGVTGSIAAYKAAELVRMISGREWSVSVVMTKAATRFVTELTFRTLSRRPVYCEMFEQSGEWLPEHISLADRASCFLIAPCTANVIAKLANGIADDLLTATALASSAPLVVAPAMNVKMWEHPATQANIDTLRQRGARIVEVGSGDLACGYQGRGRLASLESIIETVAAVLKKQNEEER